MAPGGHSWDVAARIWYAALPTLKHNATFKDAAHATISAAGKFGKSQVLAVTNAWKKVKVL